MGEKSKNPHMLIIVRLRLSAALVTREHLYKINLVVNSNQRFQTQLSSKVVHTSLGYFLHIRALSQQHNLYF